MTWPTIDLIECCEVISGFAFKSSQFGDHGIPIARIRDVVRGYSETKYKGDYQSDYVIDNGDMLIGMDGDFNIAKWKGGKALLNQRVCKVTAKQEVIDPQFLFYYLPVALHEIWLATPFVTVKHLSVKQVKSIQVPLPPLKIQKQIAVVLEKADTLRQQSQQMEQEFNSLAQSVFLDMFGNDTPSRKLGECLDFITSGSRGWAKYYADEGSRFIRSLDVQMNELSEIKPAFVQAPDGKEAERTKVKGNDVLLTITGSRIGRVCVVPDHIKEAYVSQHVSILRLRNNLLPEFLSFFLSMPSLGQRQIAQCQYGQTKPGLNLQQIKDFVIPDVTIEKQRHFVSFYCKIKMNNFLAQQKYMSHEDYFHSLMQRAFKGELDFKDVA